MKTYPKVRHADHRSVRGLFANTDHDLVITEKFDGNNVRVTADDDELVFGSRRTILDSDPDEVGEMFEDVARYLTERLDASALETIAGAYLADTVVLFGENAVQHTITEYDWDAVPQFQLFDVWAERTTDDRDSGWLPWDGVRAVATYLGLTTVPIVERTTVGEFDIDDFEIPPSVYRPDEGPAEGVVIRNETVGQKCKHISERFAERHTSAKSHALVDPEDHTGAFLAEHVTDQRIDKAITRLLADDPDAELSMELMSDLHAEVWHDVWAEDVHEIIERRWVLDLKGAHNRAAKQCADRLRALIEAGETPVAVVDPPSGDVLEPPGDGDG